MRRCGVDGRAQLWVGGVAAVEMRAHRARAVVVRAGDGKLHSARYVVGARARRRRRVRIAGRAAAAKRDRPAARARGPPRLVEHLARERVADRTRRVAHARMAVRLDEMGVSVRPARGEYPAAAGRRSWRDGANLAFDHVHVARHKALRVGGGQPLADRGREERKRHAGVGEVERAVVEPEAKAEDGVAPEGEPAFGEVRAEGDAESESEHDRSLLRSTEERSLGLAASAKDGRRGAFDCLSVASRTLQT